MINVIHNAKGKFYEVWLDSVNERDGIFLSSSHESEGEADALRKAQRELVEAQKDILKKLAKIT